MMRALLTLAVIISAGCDRVPAVATPCALRLIKQSEPPRALLSGELNNTVCEPQFLIANESESEISVNIGSKTCSCVGLFLDGQSLNAGDDFALAGDQRKTIRLTSRVSATPAIQTFGAVLVASDGTAVAIKGSQTVYIDAECLPDLITAPMRRDVSEIEELIKVVHTFRSEVPRSMRPNAVPPRGVTVVSMLPHGEPKELEPEIWRSTWQTRLKLRPAEIAEGASVRFVIEGDHSPRVQVAVPIKVTQAFGIIVPDKIAFGAVEVGAQRKRRLIMHSVDGVPFKIVKAAADSQEVSVSATESGGPTRYWIDLDFRPTHAGERHGRVSIETTHPDSPRIAIETVGRAL